MAIEAAFAVVGAGHGDEGKGLTTDWLCQMVRDEGIQPIVIRANGGAQAGHTVQSRGGRRHVHKHHGSGTFHEAPTFLSRHFVVNPIAFRIEQKELKKKGLKSDVWVDMQALVTMPMDMMINQIVETVRDSKRHGSCGWGVNETLDRSVDSEFRVTVADLGDLSIERLRWLRDHHAEARLRQLGVDNPPERYMQALRSDEVLRSFLSDVTSLMGSVNYADESDLHVILDGPTGLIFEGAQGLALDQRSPDFPHVTRSNTGVLNAARIMDRVGVEDAEVFYVTRCYATRHGNGPFFGGGNPSVEVVDETNVRGPWQGSLRIAPLDVVQTGQRIKLDLARARSAVDVKLSSSLMVTCVDHIKEQEKLVYFDDGLTENSLENMITSLSEMTEEQQLRIMISEGPTRENVVSHHEEPVEVAA